MQMLQHAPFGQTNTQKACPPWGSINKSLFSFCTDTALPLPHSLAPPWPWPFQTGHRQLLDPCREVPLGSSGPSLLGQLLGLSFRRANIEISSSTNHVLSSSAIYLLSTNHLFFLSIYLPSIYFFMAFQFS